MAVTSSNRARLTLPTDEQILIEREFDAPRHLVYRAYTTPDLVKRWWHANRGEVISIDIDLRVGGKWRYVMTACSGPEVAFRGEYREIVPNERIVLTSFYEGVPEGVPEGAATTLDTVTFTEVDGRTRLALLIEAKSKMARDAIIESGMEDGLQDALDLLERLAASLR
ncbi:MAG: SRPBCC family protein [Solirubrobacteraceae bacterium]